MNNLNLKPECTAEVLRSYRAIIRTMLLITPFFSKNQFLIAIVVVVVTGLSYTDSLDIQVNRLLWTVKI